MKTKVPIGKRRNRNGVLLPYKLIEEACIGKWDRSLAVFTQLKMCFDNGVFYDFSSRKVAKYIKTSHETLLKHLRVLEKKGLIDWVHPKNKSRQLRLRGRRHINKIWLGRMDFVKKGKVDAIRKEFEYLVVESNIRSQEFALKRGSGGKSQMWKKLESPINYVKLSDSGMAKLFDCSTVKARSIKQRLIKSKRIRVNQVWHKAFDNLTPADFFHLKATGVIPQYAHYERKSRSIFIRRSDSVTLVGSGRKAFTGLYQPFATKSGHKPH